MGKHRMQGVRATAALIVAVLGFFFAGGVASAETASPTADSGAVIEIGGDGAADVSSDGASDGASDSGETIELLPATSKEITPEEAAAAGQGETPEPAATAGVDAPGGALWIAVGVVVLLGAAFGLAQIGKRARS